MSKSHDTIGLIQSFTPMWKHKLFVWEGELFLKRNGSVNPKWMVSKTQNLNINPNFDPLKPLHFTQPHLHECDETFINLVNNMRHSHSFTQNLGCKISLWGVVMSLIIWISFQVSSTPSCLLAFSTNLSSYLSHLLYSVHILSVTLFFSFEVVLISQSSRQSND